MVDFGLGGPVNFRPSWGQFSAKMVHAQRQRGEDSWRKNGRRNKRGQHHQLRQAGAVGPTRCRTGHGHRTALATIGKPLKGDQNTGIGQELRNAVRKPPCGRRDAITYPTLQGLVDSSRFSTNPPLLSMNGPFLFPSRAVDTSIHKNWASGTIGAPITARALLDRCRGRW